MRFNILLTILLCAGAAAAQKAPATLEGQLKGKTNLRDIMKEVNKNYGVTSAPARMSGNQQSSVPATDPKTYKYLKRWARFEWEMSSRVTARGDLFDYNRHLLNETRRYEAAHSQATKANLAAGGSWSLVGPLNVTYGHGRLIGLGRMDRIAFHPANANIYYVGSPVGGLWKTADGGSNYTCLTNSLPNLSVSGIVVDYSNPNNLYILTGDGATTGLVASMGYRRGSIGVWKSTDGGSTWAQLGGATVTGHGFRLVQDPNNPAVLLAATNGGIFRTANGGTTWTFIRAGVCHDVQFRPGSSGTVYACGRTDGNYWFERSLNGGVSFTSVNTFSHSIASTNRACIGVSPADAATVYLKCGPGDTDNNTFTGLFRSTNNGLSFTRQCNSPNIFGDNDGGDSDQSDYDNCITVSPTDINRIITGGLIVYSSTNGGSSFGALTRYFDGTTQERDDFIHPDIQGLAYNPLDNKLYACTDGGVFVSSNNGSSWARKFANLPTTAAYHFDVYPGDDSHMLVGSQDNGVHKREGATATFNQAMGGDGFDVDYVHNDADKFFAVINTKVYRNITNGLTNFEKLDFGKRFFPAMAIHETNYDRFFAGLEQFHRYTCNVFADDDEVADVPCSWAIATCPSNTNRIYIAGDSTFGNSNSSGPRGTMRRSDDGGTTWTRLDNRSGFPNMTDVPKITYIGVRPNNSSHVWITIGGGTGVPGRVYASTDAGLTWTNMTGSLPDVSVNCVAVDGSNTAYVGNDFGLFVRGSGWADWKPFYNNLPRCPVTDIKLSEDVSRMRASLFGRGIWSSNMYSDCENDLTVSGSREGQQHFEAAGTITTTAASNDGAGTQVHYRAGEQVDMKTNFEVANNAQAIVRIGPCNSGIPVFNKSSAKANADFSGFRSAKMPAADKKKFPYAFIKDWEWKGGVLDTKIEQVKDGKLDLVLVDEEGTKLTELWNRNTMSSTDVPLRLNIDAKVKAKKIAALLFYNEQLVHWQELN